MKAKSVTLHDFPPKQNFHQKKPQKTLKTLQSNLLILD